MRHKEICIILLMHFIAVLFVHYFSLLYASLLLHIDLTLKIISTIFLVLYSYFYFDFGFLFSVPFVAVASLHSLTWVCISILTVSFCYSVGAVLIFLSDLLSLFFSWHSTMVVFFALRFT